MNSGDGVTVNCGCCDHDTGINHEEGTNLGQIKSSNRDRNTHARDEINDLQLPAVKNYANGDVARIAGIMAELHIPLLTPGGGRGVTVNCGCCHDDHDH